MKKIFLGAITAAFMHTTASALHVELNYGGGYTTTATTISFNYSGYADNTSTPWAGPIVAHLVLVNGLSQYPIGGFSHGCAYGSTSAVVTPPTYMNSDPYQFVSPVYSPLTATQNITFTIPTSCVPAGTYDVRLDINQSMPGWEFQTWLPSFDVIIGSSLFAQPINSGSPYSHPANETLGSAVIGTFTVTTGGPFNVAFNSVGTTCSSSGAISLNITPGTANYSVWTTPYGSPTIYSITNPVINKPAGTYPVVVVDANGCRRDGSVTVAPPTPPTVTATKSPTQPSGGYCKNTCITLLATPSTGTGYTYQWKRNGTNINTNQSFCNVAGPSPTTTTYSVTITNAFGCTASTTVSALTNTSCTALVATCCAGPRREMRPGDSTEITTSIQVYPNPAADVVNIQFADAVAAGTVLEFTDITGKTVRRVEVPEGAVCYTMNVNDLPAGMYLANVYEQETKIISTEFVVE